MQKTSGRAPRYDLPLPLRYRSGGAGSWSEGLIENISRSGVLFRADHALPLDTPVEMAFALQAGARDVLCRGRVVRIVGAGDPLGPSGVAATIAAFRFLPETPVSVRGRAEKRGRDKTH